MELPSQTVQMGPQRQGDLPVLRLPSWSAFQQVSRPQEDAVLWQRALPTHVRDWLDHIPDEQLPSGRFRLAPEDAGACIEQLFTRSGVVSHPAMAWLSQDVQSLAEIVASLSNAPSLRLRLEAVFDDACRKFHIDNVVARMICAYRGPGTQLRRSSMQSDLIETIPTGAPVLLKGKQWPQADAPTLLHRSPPIEGTGLSRLVLVLEPVQEDDEIGTSYDQRFDPN